MTFLKTAVWLCSTSPQNLSDHELLAQTAFRNRRDAFCHGHPEAMLKDHLYKALPELELETFDSAPQ